MKHIFQLAQFPNSIFEIETSVWTGRSRLIMNNKPLERANEKGKPYLIPINNELYVKAFPKSTFPDPFPALEIDGERIQLAERLQWYEYTICGLPILLFLIGGAIGGGIGALGAAINFSVFRQESSTISKYLKVAGVTIGSYLLYLLAAAIFLKIIK